MNFWNKTVSKLAKCICKIALLVLCLIFINTKFFRPNQMEFLGENLPSDLVGTSESKIVTSLHQTGHLTFGPYISLEAGSYQIKVIYATDTDNNSVNVFSGSQQKIYYQDKLKASSIEKKFKISLDEKVTDLEIRTFYMGEGCFSIEKIIVKKDILFAQILINVLVLSLFLCYEVFRRKSNYMLQYVVFVFAVLCIPIGFTVLDHITDTKLDLELGGNYKKISRPEFNVRKFISGDFQDEFESWWNENFTSRGYIITLYNQVRYSCFNLGNRVIGKEKSLFEDAYIDDFFSSTDAYDYSLEANQDLMHNYAAHLQSIKKKLGNIGKLFLVYTTVSKADAEPENIPYKYFLKYGSNTKERAIDYFRSIVGEYDFAYIDSEEILDSLEKEYPLFYKTGIHWSRPAEQEISLVILKRLREMGVPVGEFKLTTLKQSRIPYWRDADLYNLLNIYYGTMDSEYYEYATEIINSGSANILLQGGSFGKGFVKDFTENKAGNNIVNIFYNDYVEELDGTMIPITSWDTMDLGKYIEMADAIIIEINPQVLNTYSRGFVEYLDGYLDRYGSNYEKQEDGFNIDFSKEYDYSKNLISGFYWPEEGYYWVDSRAQIEIENEYIAKKGLEIDINIPSMLPEQGNVEINVNGTSKGIPLSDKGRKSIVFLPEELDGSNQYDITITTSETFVPKELGINEDERVLAIQVFYVGEKR